mgnify:CR=1 FL=1
MQCGIWRLGACLAMVGQPETPAFMKQPAIVNTSRDRLTGIALICGALLCFSGLDATAKWLTQDLSPIQVTWARYASSALFVFVLINPVTSPGVTRTKRPWLQGFRSLLPSGGTVLVSDESADYRPEMTWLTGELGAAWKVTPAEEYEPDGQALYRFFELFDWESIASARHLADGAAAGKIEITPPFKPHLEDKLWLALLWSPALKKSWEQILRGSHLKRLRELVPFGWVLDPEPLPPHAALPRLNAHSWAEVAGFSQKERKLVLKVSGFHETAWGSRGVFIGHDMPAAEWSERLQTALDQSSEQPWILQEFREARRIEHPVFREDGSVELMQGRARICPYFFTDNLGETKFGGCLATIVPADKKKIHGMTDGVLVPCVIG